jgi:hydroxyacyl-ACP dehydratase HTD2-like protein with hotdog domain
VQAHFETDVAPPYNYCLQHPKILKLYITIKSEVCIKLVQESKQQWHTGQVTTVSTVLLATVAAAAAVVIRVHWLCSYQTASISFPDVIVTLHCAVLFFTVLPYVYSHFNNLCTKFKHSFSSFFSYENLPHSNSRRLT